jgi:hypothetical protein
MTSKRPVTVILSVAMVLIGVSAVLAWIAVGGLANSTERALERMESALVTARDLADTAASSASEVESLTQVVGDGLGNTASALKSTQNVSAQVRKVLGFISFIGSIDDLKNSLKDAEAELEGLEASLSTASTTLVDAGPALHETVVALQAVPDQIDAAIADATVARKKLGDQVWLWRLAVAAGALAVMGGLWGARQNSVRVDRLMAAVAPTGPAAG